MCGSNASLLVEALAHSGRWRGLLALEDEGDLAGVVAVEVGDADDGGGHVGGADGAHDGTVDGERDRPGELEGDVVGLGQDLWPLHGTRGRTSSALASRLLIGDASTERGMPTASTELKVVIRDRDRSRMSLSNCRSRRGDGGGDRSRASTQRTAVVRCRAYWCDRRGVAQRGSVVSTAANMPGPPTVADGSETFECPTCGNRRRAP